MHNKRHASFPHHSRDDLGNLQSMLLAAAARAAAAAPRRTLSLTIASQTIARSPDGSEISSAELSVRHTGSDRRRRLPVPRKQRRHEQLQNLQPHIRSFSNVPPKGGHFCPQHIRKLQCQRCQELCFIFVGAVHHEPVLRSHISNGALSSLLCSAFCAACHEDRCMLHGAKLSVAC